MIIDPIVNENVISVKTNTIGNGDHLPKYAGNLVIINCAAIAAAEHYAKEKILISDATLRDGNHAIKHKINKDQLEIYCKAAESEVLI